MKIGMWGEMSLGEMSFGGKHRTCANFGKKWEEMSGGETSLGEKRLSSQGAWFNHDKICFFEILMKNCTKYVSTSLV